MINFDLQDNHKLKTNFLSLCYSVVVNHLDGLNPKQKEAATSINGPLLIVAGAGAGKTKTIISRIAHLIHSGVSPEKILAVTFTNKAAKEMRDRLKSVTAVGNVWSENSKGGPFVSTFHALGVYILRNNAQALGLNRHFTLLDRDDSMRKIKEAMKLAGVDPKQFEPRKILGAISREKGKGVIQSLYEEHIGGEYFRQIVSSVWGHYETLNLKAKVVDFDDLLLKTVILFRKNPEILKHYQNLWQYIHVDEYQDTNTIQYELSKLLAGGHENICIVGDIDQSIYSWRGADYTNILTFEEDYPKAKVVLLEENYRSTKIILDAANQIIKKNKNRKEKTIFTNNAEGEAIGLYVAMNESDESNYVASKCMELIKNGTPADKIAVLYRANFQSRALEEAFLSQSVPYQVLGVRFFDRKEIKDVLAYIKVALNPEDFEGMTRVINVPKRGIGKATMAKIAGGEVASLPPKMQEKISDFKKLLSTIADKITTGEEKVSDIVKFVIEKSGISGELKKGGEEELERLENTRELVTLATKYDELSTEDGILRLLTEAALISDQDTIKEEKAAVRLMTVHASKGLEFDTVFITGLEERLFPHEPQFRSDEDRDEEEERRLFYVAITRARHKIFLTYAGVRTIYGSKQINIPSEFILDLDESVLEAEASNYDKPETNFLIDF